MPDGPEILAPVGGEEQLAAALAAGADAVYFGTPDFNARRNAGNFDREAFPAAVRRCHIRGVRVYITLNTLVTDREIPALTETLRLVAGAGADAVIVQDLSLVSLVRECCPGLDLHASTQMAAHNVSGVRALERLGFRRVVLARELSLREIARIAASTDLEIEVFVHGAQCMSASGLCYLSQAFGERSGNRGLCAQPCRLDWRAGARSHALSLKDMSLISHLKALADAGADSLKIEGRMKRPEYVAAAVKAVRDTLAGERADTETLRRVFSRGGFTDGYLTGKRDLSMFGTRNKEDVTAAAGVLPELRKIYRNETPRVKLDMALTLSAGERATLTLSDGERAVNATGPEPEAARTAALTPERAGAALAKLGGTPYFAGQIRAEIGGGLTLPAAALNALRRAGVEAMDAARAGRPKPFAGPRPLPAFDRARPKNALRLRVSRAEQIPRGVDAERVILPMGELLRDRGPIARFGERIAAEIPALIYPGREESALRGLRELYGAGVRFALCENIGAIGLAREAGLTPLGGAYLNITNARALEELFALGVADATLSFELHRGALAGLLARSGTGYIAYGTVPLMRFRCCPLQGRRGCGDCNGGGTLVDRRGAAFTVLCEDRQYQSLLNSVPLYTGDLSMPPADFTTLYFTTESPAECGRITALYLAGKKPDFSRTSGAYEKRLL